jgi:hypothetical protein
MDTALCSCNYRERASFSLVALGRHLEDNTVLRVRFFLLFPTHTIVAPGQSSAAPTTPVLEAADGDKLAGVRAHRWKWIELAQHNMEASSELGRSAPVARVRKRIWCGPIPILLTCGDRTADCSAP